VTGYTATVVHQHCTHRAGADVNARGAGRFTSSALHLAAEHSNVLIVSFLLRCEGIDVDAVNVSGQTALSIAARTGSAAIAQLLLKSGADVYIASDQGHTPFFGTFFATVLCTTCCC
jgi:ankyrin repeat protein